MNNYMRPLTSSYISAKKNKIAVTVVLLATFVAMVWLDFSVMVPPAQAESEASSEAGLEAPAYLRRRRRYRYYQQQKIRQERKNEAHERHKQQKQEKQQLSHGPQIKSYGANRHKRQGQQGQTQPVQP